MKQDPLTMTLLYDYYGQMLSDKQQLCFDLYYNQDFSLTEIAEQVGISRQGVHDCITRAEAALRSMEEKTGCIAKEELLQASLADIDRCTAALLKAPQPEVRSLAEQIRQNINCIVSAYNKKL